jgi:D-alanine-D-alanine ligase-like ATP-grasp enzyme
MWRLAAGALAVRISAATSASREHVTSRIEVITSPGKIKTSIVPELASVCGHNLDELVQWMVQDASLDRRDRRGPKLI